MLRDLGNIFFSRVSYLLQFFSFLTGELFFFLFFFRGDKNADKTICMHCAQRERKEAITQFGCMGKYFCCVCDPLLSCFFVCKKVLRHHGSFFMMSLTFLLMSFFLKSTNKQYFFSAIFELVEILRN